MFFARRRSTTPLATGLRQTAMRAWDTRVGHHISSGVHKHNLARSEAFVLMDGPVPVSPTAFQARKPQGGSNGLQSVRESFVATRWTRGRRNARRISERHGALQLTKRWEVGLQYGAFHSFTVTSCDLLRASHQAPIALSLKENSSDQRCKEARIDCFLTTRAYEC
jgi:hypothetical protein